MLCKTGSPGYSSSLRLSRFEALVRHLEATRDARDYQRAKKRLQKQGYI
jgi:hypothetical protein